MMLSAALAAFAGLALADPGDLDVAKKALRDGIWNVARDHALRDGGEEARLIVLESYARESRWQDILTTLAAWGDPVGEGFTCYRALALSKSGRSDEAARLLEGVKFEDGCLAMAAVRIRAEILLGLGESSKALKLLKSEGGDDVDTRMLLAEALAATGDKGAAEAIWRDVASSADSPEQLAAVAAVKLGDTGVLRSAYEKVQTASLNRLVGVTLGIALLKDVDTFDEGSNLVKSIVRDAPDTEGAKAGFLALAEGLLDRKSWESAAETYAEALEMWPDLSKDPSFHEGRGWALSELGRFEGALEAFDRAADLAPDDSAKAMALVKSGDVLVSLGRGEEAMARYREVRERFPKTLAAERIADLVRLHELEEKGRTQYGEYRFSDAMKTFAQVASEDPTRKSRMDFYAVMCLYGQGLDEEAESMARRIADDGSVERGIRAEAMLWMAKFAYNKGRWSDAASRFAAYADLVPGSPSSAAAVVWSARAHFADNDFAHAVSTAARLASMHAEPTVLAAGLLVQAEALMELARFDEAVLVLERAALAAGMSPDERFRAQLLKADALFAMGADNQVRYLAALDAYRTMQLGADLTPTQELSLSFKIAKTLERLRRTDEAIDQYYTQVVLAYRNGREKGVRYEDEAHADFSRAAFRLADEYESRGLDSQAVSMLSLIVASEVPAADEALRRIERIRKKGKFL